jgi:hypothetical protein
VNDRLSPSVKNWGGNQDWQKFTYRVKPEDISEDGKCTFIWFYKQNQTTLPGESAKIDYITFPIANE